MRFCHHCQLESMDDHTFLMWHLQEQGCERPRWCPGSGMQLLDVHWGLASGEDQSLSHTCLPCSNAPTIQVQYTPHFPLGPPSPCIFSFPSLSYQVWKMARVKGTSGGPRLLRLQWNNICRVWCVAAEAPDSEPRGWVTRQGCDTGSTSLCLKGVADCCHTELWSRAYQVWFVEKIKNSSHLVWW